MKNFVEKMIRISLGSLIGMISYIAAIYAAAYAHGYTVSIDWLGAMECYGYIVAGIMAIELAIELVSDLKRSIEKERKVSFYVKDGNVMGR